MHDEGAGLRCREEAWALEASGCTSYGWQVSSGTLSRSRYSCIIHASPPSHPGGADALAPGTQFIRVWRLSMTSGNRAPRMILMRSLSAATVPWIQHEPQYRGTCWFTSEVT